MDISNAIDIRNAGDGRVEVKIGGAYSPLLRVDLIGPRSLDTDIGIARVTTTTGDEGETPISGAFWDELAGGRYRGADLTITAEA